LTFAAAASAQTTVVSEDFSDISDWDDLSKAVTWGGNTSATSIFETVDDTSNGSSGSVARLIAAEQEHIGYGTDDTRMFQCLDYQFASPIDRSSGNVTITVTFKARWDSRSLSNEGSRLVVSLSHDYPTGGLDLDLDDKWDDDLTDPGKVHWWARPAYNMRIRTVGQEALLIYGGGHDAWAEYETGGDPAYTWLPGFSSAIQGDSPQTSEEGCAGAGTGRYSQTEYREYQYVITPTASQLWYDIDNNGTVDGDEMCGTLDISGGYDSSGNPDPNGIYDAYGYVANFATIEGIRLFMRGSDGTAQAMIDSLSVEWVPEPATLSLLALGGVALLRKRRRR
jgi:hypothetical protein